jgi:hypothetical protein
MFKYWKFYITVAFTAMIVAKCHPVYATTYFPPPPPPVTINMPDGSSMTCIKMGTVISCQ